eukprot:scaffold20363_cov23-Cyclotella_meneghiniana.AAC.3
MIRLSQGSASLSLSRRGSAGALERLQMPAVTPCVARFSTLFKDGAPLVGRWSSNKPCHAKPT